MFDLKIILRIFAISNLAIEIGKCSTDYVNRVLERSKAGIPNGGLEDF